MNKNATTDSFTCIGRARTKKLVKYDIPPSKEDGAVNREVIPMEHEIV